MIVLAKQFRYPYRGFVITLKAKNGNIYALWSNGNRTFRRMFRNVRMIGNETRPIKDYIEDAIDKMVGPWPQARAMRHDPQPNPAYSKSWGGYRGGLRENPLKKYRGFTIDITPGNETISAYWTDGDREGRDRYSGYSMSEVFSEVKYEIDKMLDGETNGGRKANWQWAWEQKAFEPGRYVKRKRANPARGFKVTKVETSGGVTWEWLNNFVGQKTAKRLAANTDAIKQSDGSIAVQLYNTKILIFKSNGEIELRLGGWNTPTTRNRINALLPYGWGIFNKGGIPYVSNASGKKTEVPPSDKITLTETGAYV